MTHIHSPDLMPEGESAHGIYSDRSAEWESNPGQQENISSPLPLGQSGGTINMISWEIKNFGIYKPQTMFSDHLVLSDHYIYTDHFN